MRFKTCFAAMAFVGLSSIAHAQTGTPEEQAACRPDVRKFCYKIPQASGEKAFQDCLMGAKDKLSKKCLQAMMAHRP